MNVSVFKGFTKVVETLTLAAVLARIRDGSFRDAVIHLRTLLASGLLEEYDKQKKTLLAFTPSATFEGGRKMNFLKTYSQFIILDIDKLSNEQLLAALAIIIKIPFTYACFISPGGNGLKILVRVNTELSDHLNVFNQVVGYYETELGLSIDKSGKDVTRLCFMSYDPDLFLNEHAKIFEMKKNEAPVNSVSNPAVEEIDFERQYKDCVVFTQGKISYSNGNRNNFVHLLACNCNRKGLPYDIAWDFINKDYDLKDAELKATVESSYKNNAGDFGKFKGYNTPAGEEETEEDKGKEMLNMPYLPDDIFSVLPVLLRSGCDVFDIKRERDVFFTGAIAVISGCLPNVEGTYDQKTVYPNLYSFIIAPAASGKGSMSFAKELGMAYHNKLLAASKEAQKIYLKELLDYNNKISEAKRKNKSIVDIEKPEEPPFKILFIPADTSSSRVINHLVNCGESGIFCETEADTMGNAFKQEWGTYSDMLRKAFHHEPISYSRKTNNEYHEIKSPKLAVTLTGTPSQVGNLIKSAEDGLFSRFLFYIFKVEPVWRNVGPTSGRPNLTKYFSELSQQVLELVEFLEKSPTEVELTSEQWNVLNTQFQKWLLDISVFVSEDAIGSIKRFGLITYRLAMIFSALRKFENGVLDKTVICLDEDFNTAISLVRTYITHAMYMFRTLPKETEKVTLSKVKFFKDLPETFQRKQAVSVGAKYHIQPRTVDKYLHQMVETNYLQKDQHGTYSKIQSI